MTKQEKTEATLNPTETTIFRALNEAHEHTQTVLDTFAEDPDPEAQAELVKHMGEMATLSARIESGDLRIEADRFPMSEVRLIEQ